MTPSWLRDHLPDDQRDAVSEGDMSTRVSPMLATLTDDRFDDPMHYTTHRREERTAYWREACDAGWEGVIAKDATSTYVHSRSTKWLKFKCVNEQEFVVGGFTEPDGDRVGFGALLVGFGALLVSFGALLLGTYDGDELVYRGKVGAGRTP